MRTAISPIIKLKNTSGPVRHFTAPIYPPPAGNHRVDHPLIWWRRRSPDQFVRRDAASLRLTLTATHLDNETRWRDTIIGDVQEYAATAIGICVRQIKKHPIDSIEVDIAVSATLSYALLGDAACAVLMSWALKHRARIDPPCAMLSDLWLIANFDENHQ
jgi:hypothetical protein